MKRAVLFDLGNTLVQYYGTRDFSGILRQGILEARDCLGGHGLMTIAEGQMWAQVRAEDYEAADYRVRPLEERLARIFDLAPVDQSPALLTDMCRHFLKPIFARGRLYEDALPTMRKLKAQGYTTAIVSNTSWGSPADLWRAEVLRHGLDSAVDAVVFCRDCGWRKPATAIFRHAPESLDVRPEECLFVGDDPRWDIAGPRAVGMDAILMDRSGAGHDGAEPTIIDLQALLKHLA